jgi:hypothetical protein
MKQRYVSFAPSQAQPILEDIFLLCGQRGFTKFVSDLELYEIVSKSEQELHGKSAPMIADPARRRETKIKQYQAEKDIRARIEVSTFIQTIQSRPMQSLKQTRILPSGHRDTASRPSPTVRHLPDRL